MNGGYNMIGKVKIAMLRGEKGDTGATGDYSGILNKPQINGVTLDGNKTASDLGLATASEQQNILDSVVELNDAVSGLNDSVDGLNDTVAELETKDAFIVTADFDNMTYDMSNLSASINDIVAAVQAGRPCFIIGNYNNSNNKVIATCQYATSYGSASFTFCNFNVLHYYELQGGGILHEEYVIPYHADSGTFTANNGVTAASDFYVNAVASRVKECSINFSASGTFASGTTSLGTFNEPYGIPCFDANGIVGTCALRTGNNGLAFDAVGTFTLAEDGSLSVYSSVAFNSVSLTVSWIYYSDD